MLRTYITFVTCITCITVITSVTSPQASLQPGDTPPETERLP